MSRDREADEVAILHALDNGAENVHDITQQVTFNRRRVNYLLVEQNSSLEDRGLVTVEQPRRERVHVDDGDQMRNRWAAKRVALTEDGVKALIEADVDPEQERDVSKEELLEMVRDLEGRVERLESAVKGLRETVASDR